VHLLPQPRSVQLGTGEFVLRPDLAIDGTLEHASVIRRLLGPGCGLDLPVSTVGGIAVRTDDALPAEGYRLAVTELGIAIEVADARGLSWATQTLRQLLPPAAIRPAPDGSPLRLPAVQIEDHPQFAWRGVHLDVARHFMPLPDLYRFVDLIALHKFNTVQLHLTDDQGWRFESLRHPRLQEVASWRRETRRPQEADGDGTPHGGYYTQDQLRSLVAFADHRGVTIVPEIEFPGHVVGVLAAYPELGNHPETPGETATTFGVFEQTLNLSDAAMAFVFDVYAELLDVFPSRYVHVGGDECPTAEWDASADARRLAERRGIGGPEHLQRWFTEQLRGWLAGRGRVLVGWDEIAEGGPVPGAVVMAWRDAAYGVAAAMAGSPIVQAPLSHTYFDYYPSDLLCEPYAIGGHLTTEQVYTLDPLAGVAAEAQHLVLGTQGQVWTEYLPTMRRVEYALFPRACALGEVAWSDPVGRSWAEFQPRLAHHLDRLAALGVNFRPEPGPHPWQQGGTGQLRRPGSISREI
jgi:hexosaminidase